VSSRTPRLAQVGKSDIVEDETIYLSRHTVETEKHILY
jgi:hypothetical protein